MGYRPPKDVKLSNIFRSLNEDQALIKTENRLSRNLDDIDLQKVSIMRYVVLVPLRYLMIWLLL